MKFFRYRRPSLNTLLGITKAKKRIKKELGITEAMKPFRWWTNTKRRFKRKIGYESEAGRLIRNGLPRPGGCWWWSWCWERQSRRLRLCSPRGGRLAVQGVQGVFAMTEILLGVVVVCLLAVIGLQVALLLRKVGVDLSPLQHTLEGIDKSYERVEGAVREEIAKNRSEASAAARQSREELSNSLKAVADTLAKRFDALTQATSATLKGVSESLVNNIGEMAKLQKGQLDVFSERLDKLTQTNEQKLDKMRETIEQRLGVLQEDNAKKLAEMRQEAAASSQKTREEVTIALKAFNESVGKTINDFVNWQRRQFGGVMEQLKGLTEANEKRLVEVRTTVEERLKTIQEDNAKNLEQMRQTVDEKLQGTLEKRLGESFKLVSERLEQVYKGLGEMQTLAVGVGDLKRVLTNVKARGTWGEVQLEADAGTGALPGPIRQERGDQGRRGAGGIRHQAAGPGRRQGRDRVAAHRRQVPHRRLPAAPGRPGKGRCRTGRSCRQATGEPHQGCARATSATST